MEREGPFSAGILINIRNFSVDQVPALVIEVPSIVTE